MKNFLKSKNAKILGYILFTLFCVSVLTLSVRGLPGNPTPIQLNLLSWKDNGPLELSPERGRFALLYSLVEDHSFAFSPDLARFTAPDVGYTNGHFVSLFAPGVSFLIIPGYVIGKMFGFAQVGAFAVVALFALINVFLIRAIAVRLGANSLAGLIAGLAFLFATPAYAYAVTLYEHHFSTFIILLALYLLIRFNTVWSLIGIWLLCGFSVSIDYPNFFMMLPIGVAAAARMFTVKKEETRVALKVSIARVLSVMVVVLPLAFLLWFNYSSNGNPFTLSGAVDRSLEVTAQGKPVLESTEVLKRLKAAGQPAVMPQGTLLNLFNPRDMLNGFYIHFISPDRGILIYTPIMLFGFVGLFWAIKRKEKYVGLMTAIIGFDVLLYSMWGDPYGGWSFGSRYLIPSYAILSLYIAYLLKRISKYNILLLLFFAVLTYSIGVNTLGAITSNRNPPQIEAEALSHISGHDEPYTYERNLNILNANQSKAVVFEAFAGNYITAWNYYLYLTGYIVIFSAFLVMTYKSVSKGRSHEV